MDLNLIDKRLRRTKSIGEVFDLSSDAFLVGGYIRDIASGKKRPLDADFILKKRISAIAQEVALRHEGTVVILGNEGLTRVVMRNKRILDFTRYHEDIEDDLRRRDFTVNSIAWSPMTGILDPCKGIIDIKQGVIRSFSTSNLIDDPLRMLRAYRFRSQFGWKIEPFTREFIKAHARLLENVAPERITLELFKTLEGDSYLTTLRELQSDNILNRIIPLNNNVLRDNIKLISRVDSLTAGVYVRKLPEKGFQGLRHVELLKLSLLLLGVSLRECRLALSNKVSKRIELIGEYFYKFKALKTNDYEIMYKYFEGAGEASEDLIILSGKHYLSTEMKRFMRIQNRPSVGAETVMSILGIEEGEAVGKVLMNIKARTFARTLRNKGQIINYLKSNMK